MEMVKMMEKPVNSHDKITVDIVLPVYNEEQLLENTVKKLFDFFTTKPDFDWSIIIASNGSTDKTKEIGENLARTYANIRFFHILETGRGRALKKAFRESKASVCVYTDIDLPIDISTLFSLIKLAAEHKTIALPNRRFPSARMIRPRHRIIFTNTYNFLIKLLFPRTNIKDAQVGMKAIHRRILEAFLEKVSNNNFFFDTELLLLTEKAGYPIIQIPADSYDIRRGKVNFFFCILEEFLGLIKMKIKLMK